MKSVLTSIQPYYVFLIIARAMGWRVEQEKTVEVRKNFPKAPDWDKRVIIYCTKSKRSFKRIPKEYQPLMAPLLGKVIGEFVCDFFDEFERGVGVRVKRLRAFFETCLDVASIRQYMGEKNKVYGWHISDLKIYDKPKELSEFTRFGYFPVGVCCGNSNCKNYIDNGYYEPPQCAIDGCFIKSAPQSWCYLGG